MLAVLERLSEVLILLIDSCTPALQVCYLITIFIGL